LTLQFYFSIFFLFIAFLLKFIIFLFIQIILIFFNNEH